MELDNSRTAQVQRAIIQAHAHHQDQLVQQYRTHLGLFEVALAATIGMAATVLFPHPIQLALVLAPALWGHLKVGRRFREAIAYRQKDVDWAHRQLLLVERDLPAKSRVFTSFKLYQDRDSLTFASRAERLLSDHRASEEQIDEYFFAHMSLSRNKSAQLLALPAHATRALGLMALMSSAATCFNVLP